VGKPFEQEINRLSQTCVWAFDQSVDELRRLMTRWTDGPLIVVGSGGSYSAAAAWATFHRQAFGQPSFACTPLGLSDALSTLKQCRVLLLSAEGKNNDVLNAAKLSASHDVPCAAITLTIENPLVNFGKQRKSLYTFSYEMDWEKDGYLATNTLFAIVLLAARCYFDVAHTENSEMVSSEAIATRRRELVNNPFLRNIRKSGALVVHG